METTTYDPNAEAQKKAISEADLATLQGMSQDLTPEDLLVARQLALEQGGVGISSTIAVEKPDGTIVTKPVTEVGSLRPIGDMPNESGNGDHWINPQR